MPLDPRSARHLCSNMSTTNCNPPATMKRRRRRIRSGGGGGLLAALALLLPSSVDAGLEIGGVTSTDACYAALQAAQLPGQAKIDQEGYVQFVNALSDDAFTAFQYSQDEDRWDFFPATEFDQLPAAVRGEFYKHACGGEYVICENAFLYTEGTEGGNVAIDAQQEIYLYQVCVGVEGAIDESLPSSPDDGGTPTPPTYPPTVTPPTQSPAATFSGEKQLQLVYRAAVSESVSTEDLQSSESDVRKDLLGAMTSWSFMTGNNYYRESSEAPQKRGKPAYLGMVGGRRLRGAEPSERGLQEVRTVRPKPLVADPNEQESMKVVDVPCPEDVGVPLQTSDHCIEVTTTLTLIFEDEPPGSEDGALKYFEDSFDSDIRDGTFYGLIPPKSQPMIRTVYPVPDAESVEGNGGVPAPTPSNNFDQVVDDITRENIEAQESDSEGSSNTAGIVSGVIVGLVVVGIGMYVWHRRRQSYSGDGSYKKKSLKDGDLAGDLEGARVKDGHSHGYSSRDEFSHSSSQGSSSVASYSESGSKSSGSSSSSYTSTSGSYSRSAYGSSHTSSGTATADNSAALTESGAETDSYDTSPQNSGSGAAQTKESLRMSTQSDFSHPYEASDRSSGSRSLESDRTGSSGRRGGGAKNRSHTTDEDSSAGSSGWDSSDGDSSVDTEGVESFDPNTIRTDTLSGSSATADGSGPDEANMPAMVNPAVNPVVQRGVTMIPITEMDHEDSVTESTPASDESSSHSNLGRRRDEAPLGGDIQDAIEKGDWAAVGATAAILASDSSAASTQHDDNLTRDASTASGSVPSGDMSLVSGESSTVDEDDERAAEIDQLVELGNWDGVVAVAARYADEADEADESLSRPLRSSIGKDNSPKSKDSVAPTLLSDSAMSGETGGSGGSVSVESAASSSIYDSIASHSIRSSLASSASLSASQSGTDPSADSKSPDDPENATHGSSISTSYLSAGGVGNSMLSAVSSIGQEKRQMGAYRAEVEALVRRVVPDEIDNVDDIMVQFSGREEELIETLRAMQEKSIAQRARAAVQKSAKKEAGRSGRKPDESSGSELGGSMNTDDYTTDGQSAYTTDGQSYTTDRTGNESITIGDDYSSSSRSSSGSGSVSSSSSRSSDVSGTESGSPDSKKKATSGLSDAIDASDWKAVGEAAKHMQPEGAGEQGDLDDLIEEGNWSGIIDAASKMGEERERDLPEELD